MEEPVKVCFDCTHCDGAHLALCALTKHSQDVVSGRFQYARCEDARAATGLCGPHALNFERRMSFIERVTNWATRL